MTLHTVRPMIEADLELVLQWRNHPDIRRYMYTTHEISMTEHRHWFRGVDANPAVALLIYEQGDRSHGFASITRTRSWPVADWGFYIAPDAPKGSGRHLGCLVLKFAFDNLALHKICGQALSFNQRSIGFHEALGFSVEGCLRDHHFDGQAFHDVVCFGLLKSEWQNRSEG